MKGVKHSAKVLYLSVGVCVFLGCAWPFLFYILLFSLFLPCLEQRDVIQEASELIPTKAGATTRGLLFLMTGNDGDRMQGAPRRLSASLRQGSLNRTVSLMAWSWLIVLDCLEAI